MAEASVEQSEAANVKKIVVFGSIQCGKSFLVKALIELLDSYESAVSYWNEAFCNLEVDGTNYTLLIKEAQTQENFIGERSVLYEDADVVILCFSIDDMRSYLRIAGELRLDVRQNRPDVPLVVVGTKSDLRLDAANRKLVSYNNGQFTANTISAFQYVECSANTKENVIEVFTAAVKATLQ